MRPSCLAVSILILCIFLSSVQGIRLQKSSKSVPKLHEGALMETRNGDMGEMIECKEGKCTGKSRKLFSAITSTGRTSTTTSKSQENNGEKKANPSSKVKAAAGEEEKQEKFSVGSPTSSEHQEFHDQYADIMDIAEMDYSPAKRKPPIHN